MLQNLSRRPRATADKTVLRLRAHVDLMGAITCPLVLVSQISRSGGTWLSQLFDHHPEVWAHPAELKICYPDNWTWPDLSSAQCSDDVWHILSHAKLDSKFSGGLYSKGPEQALPIVFDVETHRALFLSLGHDLAPATDRDWLNLYFTAFFFAWLDYQRRYTDKRCITAFAPILALYPETMAAFRKVYPDGHLISVIREPISWYSSVKKKRPSNENAKKHDRAKRHYAGFEHAEAAYLDNVQAMRANADLFSKNFIIIDYGALVADTEGTMLRVGERLGLDFHPTLTRQTFNGMPIRPNSSFANENERRSALTDEEAARILEGPMMQAYEAIRGTCSCGSG
jgi:hypothetical protein